MAEPHQPKWNDVKRSLARCDRDALLSLLQELYKLDSANRIFLATRLTGLPPGAGIEPYRRRVAEPFYPSRGGIGDLKFTDARKAVREYERASGDLRGTLDLMLTFVETGNAFTHEFGDITEGFYSSLESMLDTFLERLRQPEGRDLFPEFERRLETLAKAADGIGWGYSDHVVGEIEHALAEFRQPPPARQAT